MRFACIPACLGTLASWFLTRDDDLDCEARDVWVTPFTPILMKRYLQCSVRGELRCGHVWNSPCASKQFLILYLHLHYSTFILSLDLELFNSYQECRDIAITMISPSPGLSRTHRLDSDLITPIPNVPPIIFRFPSNNGHCGGIKINNEVLSLRPFLHSAKEIHFWLDIGWYLISLLMRLTWPASRSLYSPRLTLTTFLAHYFTIFYVCKVQDLSKNKSVNCFMGMS